MKKILTLFALLMCFATGAWAGIFDGKIIKSKGEAATTMQAGTYIMYNQTHQTYFNLSSAGQLHLDSHDDNFVGSSDVNYVVNIVEGTTAGTWAFQVSNGKYIPQLNRGATTGQSETPYYFTMSYDGGWTIQEVGGNSYYFNGNGPGPATFAGWNGAHKYTLYPVELAEAPKGPVEAGKCYYIYNDNYSGGADVKYYLSYNGSALGLAKSKSEDTAYMWRCEQSGSNYTFRNVATGTYLGWQAMSNTAYAYTVGNSTQQSGFYTLKGVTAGKYLVIPNNGSKFDQSTHPNYAKKTSGYSADFQFEECDPSSLFYSENFANATWLRVANSSDTNYFMTVKSDDKAGSLLHTATGNAADAGQLFALVGDNETGFVIYNKLLGENFTLTASGTSNGTGAIWAQNAANPTKWFLVDTYVNAASQPGYSFTTNKTSSTGLNMYGGAGGDVKYYTAGPGNGGSRWTMSLVDGTPTIIHYVVNGEKKYNDANRWLGQLKIQKGSYTSTSFVETNVAGTTFEAFLPKSSEPLSVTNVPLHGWNCKVTEAGGEYTVTYTADQETEYQYLAYDPSAQWYRIPAIVSAQNGDLVAVYDYRVCHNDVGFGEVDQVMRRSSDFGNTWTAETKIADGKGNGKVFGAAFGDPALVADRESGKMTLITVSGTTVYTSANATDHNLVSVQHSDNNGLTWSEPRNITDQFWGAEGAMLADAATASYSNTYAYAGFFGSGKILQSRKYKVGDYYRLYAALLCQGKNVSGAYVVYSDDLGDTWKLLGGNNAVKASPNSNEPKVEELPNGDIVLSGRKGSGRYFNVWHWTTEPTSTDKEGVGSWGSEIDSNASSTPGGIKVGGNSTNGEILYVDVLDNEGNPRKLMLQSLPAGSNRSLVEIWYKDITDASTYASSLAFASNWTQGLRVSNTGSAYSTMCLQQDGRIGFFYEEEPGTYAMVYVPLTIEKITNSQYKGIVPELPTAEYIEAVAALKNAYSERANVELGEGWLDYVAIGSEDLNTLLAEVQPYMAKSPVALYNEPVAIETITDLAARLEAIRIVQNCKKGCFVLLKGYSGNYVSGNKIASGNNAAMSSATDASTIFYLSPEGELICLGTGMGFIDTRDITTNLNATYSHYTISASGRDGKYYVRCNNNTNASLGTYLYDNTANGTKLDRNGSPVTSGSYQTDWTIIEVKDIPVNINAAGFATYNSPVQVKVPNGVTAHTAAVDVTDKSNPTITFTKLEGDVIPANTPVLLKGAASTQVTLSADNSAVTAPAVNDLHGTMAAKALTQTTSTTGATAYYYVLSGEKFVYATTKVNGFRGYLFIDLPYNANTGSNLRMIFDDELLPTAIEAIEELPAEATIYDLQGRRLSKAQQGVNIINGHKVIVK